jgi:hypothetical protein
MENQHRLIKGYRELDEEEIQLINRVKEMGEVLASMIEALEVRGSIDRRWLAIARTDLQTGIMAAVRSITKPDSF